MMAARFELTSLSSRYIAVHRRQPSRCCCTLPLSRLDSPDRMNAPRCSLTHRQSVSVRSEMCMVKNAWRSPSRAR